MENLWFYLLQVAFVAVGFWWIAWLLSVLGFLSCRHDNITEESDGVFRCERCGDEFAEDELND